MTAGYTAGLSPRVVGWGLSPGYYRHVPSLLSQELKGKSYHMCYQKTWTAGYAGLSPKAGDQGFLPATFIGIQRNYSSKVVPPLTATSPPPPPFFPSPSKHLNNPTASRLSSLFLAIACTFDVIVPYFASFFQIWSMPANQGISANRKWRNILNEQK